MCSLFANSNRDPKKQKSPYKIDDFFLYEPQEQKNTPSGSYGAAAIKLVEERKFPLWALTFFSDLKRGASGNPPELLAYSHEKAIVLAPVIDGEVVKGMLIAEEVVSEKILDMQSPNGEKIKLQMPKLTVRYSAQEDLELPIMC